MNGAQVFAEILKREGVDFLACYARNPVIESCAEAGIRTLHCRQERIGVGIADGFSRAHFGERVGVVAVQGGPGIENTFPGVAQAFSENIPVLVITSGEGAARQFNRPVFRAVDNYRHVTKWAARVDEVAAIPDHLRRAFHLMRCGRPGPVLLEVAGPVWNAEFPGEVDYVPPRSIRAAPDPADISAIAEKLLAAERPIVWAGAGVLRARASAELVALAELLDSPVMTTNPGKSAFPEDHPLSLGAAAGSRPLTLQRFLIEADCVLAIGSSLTRTPFGPNLPPGKVVLHATNAPDDINKDYAVDHAAIGDAKLVLEALIGALGGTDRRDLGTAAKVAALRAEWLGDWQSHLDSDEMPMDPYRILRELMETVDPAQAIITHDSGGPREQLLPFWRATEPGGYMGWGKTTQLGYGLGIIMGAKLAKPEKLCVNLMGDASIGMVGLDLETAARHGIGILTIVFNNGVMAMERSVMATAIERFQGHTLGGNYAEMANALGVAAERVEAPDAFGPALARAIAATEVGRPALIECLTKESTDMSRYG